MEGKYIREIYSDREGEQRREGRKERQIERKKGDGVLC